MGKLTISSANGRGIGSTTLNINKGKIVSIELLEGDKRITNAEVIQYVNIQKNVDKHINPATITHADRAGQKLRLKVKFDKAGVFAFKVKLTPNSKNATYISTETTKNANFKYSDGFVSSADSDGDGYIKFTTDNNGEKIIAADKLFVSSAGGDVFTISAKDANGNEIKAKSKVKTQRLMYYMDVKIEGLKGGLTNLKPFITEYKKHGVKIKPTTSAVIRYSANIDPGTDLTNFENIVNVKYSGAPAAFEKAPYCVVVTYAEHVKVKASGALPPVAVFGGNNTPVRVPVEDSLGNTYALWNNVVPGEDWFIDCYFVANSNGNVTPIPKSKCKLNKSIKKYPNGYYCCVDINVSSLPKEAGNITLEVNIVEAAFAGVALKTKNIVGVCLRPWWKKASKSEQIRTIIHEVGHKFGMVPDNTTVNTTPYHYNGMGHVGHHCSYGMPPGLSTYKDMGKYAKCVMFGETSDKKSFCAECAKALKKVDLSGGV